MIFSVTWYLMSPWQLFGWHFLWISEQIMPWMMDECIHGPKPYLLLSTTCDEIMSWMIKIWMINLVSDNTCNIVGLQHLVLVTLHCRLQLVLSNTNWVELVTLNIICSVVTDELIEFVKKSANKCRKIADHLRKNV
jgi:hypothetical protein